MKVLFMPAPYHEGEIEQLSHIFEVYNNIGSVLSKNGHECFYFCRQSPIITAGKILSEADTKALLPEIGLLFSWRGLHEKELPIIEQCRWQGTPMYFSEQGWFPQFKTLYFDRKGINYGSAITHWKYEPLEEWQEYELNPKLAFYHHEAKKTDIDESDFVFVPFQVENDSQIWKYSPRFKKMQELVDYVSEFVPGKIIFKTHPKGSYGEIKVPDRCKLYTTGTTHDFLPACKYCVTINSTVGLEAMTYMKPVITLGQSFYGGKGAFDVNSDARMIEAVEWAEKGKVAIGMIRAFLYYLFQKQWHKCETRNPQRVMSLVRDLCV